RKPACESAEIIAEGSGRAIAKLVRLVRGASGTTLWKRSIRVGEEKKPVQGERAPTKKAPREKVLARPDPGLRIEEFSNSRFAPCVLRALRCRLCRMPAVTNAISAVYLFGQRTPWSFFATGFRPL